MLRNRLNYILLEQRLRISKVANDTGISRTTLTALAQNQGKGIQYDTLDTLCRYLNITPSDFFEYINVKYNIQLESILRISDYNYELIIFINFENGKKESVELKIPVKIIVEDDLGFFNPNYVSFKYNSDIIVEFLSDDEYEVYKQWCDKLPIDFIRDLKENIAEKIKETINNNKIQLGGETEKPIHMNIVFSNDFDYKIK